MESLIEAAPEWLGPFLPTARMTLLGTPLALTFVVAAASAAARLRTRRGVAAPFTRKAFHFLVITGATAVHLGWGLRGVTLFGSVVTVVVLYAVLKGDGFPFYEALARPTDAPHRALFVLLPLATTALGGVLANVLFAPFAPVGYAVMGWGDAAGEPVGVRWGRNRYRVSSLAGVRVTRSVEGSLAVLVLGLAAAAVVLLVMGFPPAVALAVGAACGVAAALVEAVSSHGLDNLTVQLVAAALSWAILS